MKKRIAYRKINGKSRRVLITKIGKREKVKIVEPRKSYTIRGKKYNYVDGMMFDSERNARVVGDLAVESIKSRGDNAYYKIKKLPATIDGRMKDIHILYAGRSAKKW